MRRLIMAALLAVLPFSANAFEIKISTMYPDGTAAVKSLKEAGDKIKQDTDGRVSLRVYAGGVMGDDAAVERRIRIGQLHGALAQGGAFVKHNRDAQVLNLPLLFRDADEVAHVRETLDPVLREGFKKNDWTVFGPVDGGFAYFMTKSPVATVAELRRQKVWMPANDSGSAEAAKEFGVSPVVLSISAVLTSLQTGVINAYAAPPIAALTLQWYSRVNYLTEVPMLYTYALLGLSDRHLQRISAEDRAVMEKILTDTFADMDVKERQDNQSALDAVLSQGLEVVSPTAEERQEWQDYADKANQKLLDEGHVSQGIYDQIMDLLQDYRGSDDSRE